MATREMIFKYSAEGTSKVQKQDESLRASLKETSKTADKEVGTIDRWMTRHKTAIMGIGAATTAVMGGIISSSSALSGSLGSMRLAFSTMAAEIGNEFAPAFTEVEDSIWSVESGFTSLNEESGGTIGLLIGIATAGASAAAGIFGIKAAVMATVGTAGLIAGFKVAGIGAIVALAGAWVFNIGNIRDKTTDMIQEMIGDTKFKILKWTLFLPQTLTYMIIDWLKKWGGMVSDTISESESLKGALKNIFSNTKTMIANKVEDIVFNVRAKFSSLVSSAKKWGSDLVSNFADGLDSKLSDAKDSIGGIKNEIKKNISFDIKSNDRMARRWGSDLVREFNRGILKERGELKANVSNLSGGSGGRKGSSGGDNIEVVFESGSIVVGGRGGRSSGREVGRQVSKAIEDKFASRR